MKEINEQQNICEILRSAKTIAIVGISSKPVRASREIAEFLRRKGYKVYGVNPTGIKIDGIPVYKKLIDIPEKIDIIDVFRKSESIEEIIPDVLKTNPKVLWLQLGIRNDQAVNPVVENGIYVIQDKCIKITYNECN